MEDAPDTGLEELDSVERMRLLRFVCSFAWADLEIAESERAYVAKLMSQLDIDDQEKAEVKGWLAMPPDPDTVDPTEIPREHRQIFLKKVLELVMADGVVDSHEVESFAIFEQLLR